MPRRGSYQKDVSASYKDVFASATYVYDAPTETISLENISYVDGDGAPIYATEFERKILTERMFDNGMFGVG